MKKIYLDHNATSPISPDAWISITRIWNKPYNASSVHSFGAEARELVEGARDKILDLVGMTRDNAKVVFTSSGTESNNLVFQGLGNVKNIISSIEHVSVSKPAASNNIHELDVDLDGVVKIGELEDILKKAGEGVLVSVMLVNNETGVIQPIKEIAEIAHKYGAIVHTDAVQAFGRIDVSMEDLGVDIITISSHKIGGPLGSAALIFNNDIKLNPVLLGGGQEGGLRAGTENVSAIQAFGAVAAKVKDNFKYRRRILKLRDKIEKRIKSIAPEVIFYGQEVPRICNTSCILMPGVPSEEQLMNFDLEGIAVSAGSACSSGKIEPSNVLMKMGATKEDARCSIRVSLGLGNDDDDVRRFIKVWEDIYDRMQQRRELSAA